MDHQQRVPASAVEQQCKIEYARLAGRTWPGFSPTSITTIKPAAAEITEFTIVNPYTKEIIYRPAGTAGEQDRIPDTPSPTPPDTSEPPQTAPPPVPETQPPVEPLPPVQPQPQPQVRRVEEADIAGTYTLNRSVISCTGFEQCYTDPITIHIDGCGGRRCTITWPDGWARSHTLTFDGTTWRTSGSDEGANDCNGEPRPGSIRLELTVVSADVVDGTWKAQRFRVSTPSSPQNLMNAAPERV